jgi:hypothetical protein
MFRRIGWILASYLTRPVILALCVLGLVIGGCTSLVPRPRSFKQINFPQIPQAELSVDSVETLEMVRSEGRQAEVDGINLNYLWADMEKKRLGIVPSTASTPQVWRDFKAPGADFFRVVEAFPNLRSVRLTLYGDAAVARLVVRLPKLEYLEVDGSLHGNMVDVRWLDQAKRLEFLKLGFYRPVTGLEALVELPRLRTLAFDSRLEVSDAVLRQVAELAQLKTLVITVHPMPMPVEPLSAAGFAALAHAKALETLYVGSWDSEEQASLLEMARRGASRGGLKIEPALVEKDSPFLFFVLYPAGMLAAAIGVGLSGAFRGPASRLAPRFAPSHAAVAAALAVAVIVLTAWRVTAGGNDPLAATIAAVAAVCTVVSMTSGGLVEAQVAQRLRKGKGILWLKQALFFFLLGSLALPSVGPPLMRGEMPGLLAALGLVSAASIVLTVVTLRGMAHAPEIVELPAGAGARTRAAWQMQFRPGWMFATAGSEDRIERWIQRQSEWTWWQRVGRWRMGNPPLRSERMMAMMLAVMVPVLWLMDTTILAANGRMGFAVLRGQVLLVAGLLAMTVAIRVATTWRLRMLMLPLESLRPYGRRALQNEMAAGLVADVAPSVALVAAFDAIGLNLNSAWQVAWARVPGDFALMLTCVLPLVVGLAAMMVVVKREWLAISLVLAVPVLLGMALMGLAILQADAPARMFGEVATRAFFRQLWIPGVLGAGLAYGMYRRWLAMGIGSRA